MDWTAIFIPTLHLGEVFLRGTLVYLFIFAILRMLRREAGSLSISDLLVIVLIADAAQNAMASEYKSITEGFVLIATIVFWDYFLDWLAYRFEFFDRLLKPAPLLLIRNGRIQHRNLEKEMISEEELMEHLRQEGVDKVSDVKASYIESNGQISVVKTDQK